MRRSFKKRLLAAISVGCIGVSCFAGWEKVQTSEVPAAAPPAITIKSTKPPVAHKISAPIGQPMRVRIPAVGIDAEVKPVGLTSSGDMDVPSTPRIVGWYQFGPAPGKPGNAVMDGHLENYGTPAIFQNLHKLHPGDVVEVLDNKEQTIRFRVVELRRYQPNDAPLEQIFGDTKQTRLNLVTCEGVWDQKQREYSKRLVVFTEIVR